MAVDHELARKVSETLDRSVYRGVSDRRSVALTFDDGPSLQTPELLAFLAQHRVRATFFQGGLQVQRYPEIARSVQAQGHEIGNHAWSHVRLAPHLSKGLHLLSPGRMYQEVARTQRLLTEVHGIAPRLFRPPFGDRWLGLDAVQYSLGLRCIQWTVIGHDWEWPAERIAQRILSKVSPGAILCLHDGRDVQPTADLTELLASLRVIIPALKQAGYGFETVGQLLTPRSLVDSVGTM